MAAPNVILDPGPLVGLLDASDQCHARSLARFNELPSPMLTREAVLSQATYLLGGGPAAARLFELVELGALDIAPLFPHESPKIRASMKRIAGRAQLADACVVPLSELHPLARVLTCDREDFRVYRRNRHDRRPMMAP